jgi:hypothetical protein
MADKNDKVKINAIGAGANDEITTTWKEMPDGTYAQVIAASLQNSDGDALLVPDTFKTLKTVAIGSIATVWTPASGNKVRLMGGSISVSAAVSVLFEDNAAGTDVFQTPVLAADTPYNFDLGNGVLLSAIDNVLKATSSAAANIIGTLYGIEE